MTLDEAIIRAKKEAHNNDVLKQRYDDASGYTRSGNETIRTKEAKICEKCAVDYLQLAEWLEELKSLKERSLSDDEISREDALMALTEEWEESKDELIAKFVRRIRKLPSVFPKCEDAISRQDAIKEATKEGSYDYISAYELPNCRP